mmetsp:Transcript_65249/g.72879  ORF Transcript_65249/g.72879 Transcript_65249/m.72879 type:complete len:353 (-) Transcript_65249:77-1135(-)
MEVNGNNKNEEMIDADPIVHWERLQDSGRKRMKLMEDKKDKLQKEIDTMNSVIAAAAAANISGDEIIEINAGGKIISVFRSTLTLASDTVFAYMFSGRWEGSLKRDSNGRVFLNNDPELFEIIVNFLRTKSIEDPSSKEVIVCPEIPKGKEQAFRVLLNYFGLTDFFYPPCTFDSLDIDNIDVVLPHDSSVDVTKSKNMIQFLKGNRPNNWDVVICKPTLDSSGEGSFWKVTIDALPGAWIFLGIIGNLDASDSSYDDSTCYGWAGYSEVYQGGTERIGDSGWTGFTQEKCLHFHLKAKKLTMFSVQKNQKFTIDVATTVHAYYIQFNMLHKGTKVTLEPLNDEERARFLSN